MALKGRMKRICSMDDFDGVVALVLVCKIYTVIKVPGEACCHTACSEEVSSSGSRKPRSHQGGIVLLLCVYSTLRPCSK
jgi:hypothetical protein